jgi:transposase
MRRRIRRVALAITAVVVVAIAGGVTYAVAGIGGGGVIYHRQFANNLLNRWPALSTFTHTDGVGPTNNHAERGLRGAVIYRKLSLGSQSDQGERTIERLLSASVTCRPRKQSLYNYLSQVIAAHARGDPIPRLA